MSNSTTIFDFEAILNNPQDSFFGESMIQWYQIHKRDLPWRHTKNPYLIWLSEVILQQTRVNQGMPYYHKFVENYPKVQDLAQAPQDEVLRLWQGLGYYARARNMHSTAKMVVADFGGNFPMDFLGLLQLKGVGHYTASAIASFAYNEAVAVLDGNVYRVLARYFGIKDAINTPLSIKNFQKLAQKMLITQDASTYNQAIMEFGALQCTSDNPNCMFCPLQASCVAFQTEQQKTLPYKIPKKAIKERFFTYFVLKNNEKIALQKREKGDIWEGLYEFILVEQEKADFANDLLDFPFVFSENVKKNEISLKKNPKTYTHQLTHQKLFIKFLELNIKIDVKTDINAENTPVFLDSEASKHIFFYEKEEIENLPKPIVLAKYLAQTCQF